MKTNEKKLLKWYRPQSIRDKFNKIVNFLESEEFENKVSNVALVVVIIAVIFDIVLCLTV